MKNKTVIALDTNEVRELSQELNIYVQIDSCNDSLVSLEYREEDKEREELAQGKTFEDMYDDILIALIDAINKKHNTNIPNNAKIFCANGVDFDIGLMF